MPRILLVFLLLVGGVALALALSGVFDGEDEGVPAPGEEEETPPRGENGREQPGLGGTSGSGTGPVVDGQLEPLLPDREVRVLLLSPRQATWTSFSALAWKGVPGLKMWTYYFDDTEERRKIDSVRTAPPGRLPDGAWLEEHKIDVLYLHDIDPAVIDNDFWRAVDTRVRAGEMGLLLQVPTPSGRRGESPTVHAMLTNPILRELAPVEDAYELRGQSVDGVPIPVVPGIAGSPQPIEVTDAGTRHPATRLTPVPRTSRTLWSTRAEPEDGLRTQFVYPVKRVREGAKALLEMRPDRGLDEDHALVIVGKADKGRVLWLGSHGLGYKAHWNSEKAGWMSDAILSWPAWLAGFGED